MAELKTKLTQASVADFLNAVEDEQKREDCWTMVEIMEKATQAKPEMWGPSIVGFGRCHYRYESGREGDWMLIGFAPRKQNITLYLMCSAERDPELLAQLGKYSCGKSCLYIKQLKDVHLPTLKKLVKQSVQQAKKMYPSK